MTKLNDVPQPLNANERLLYAIIVRQNVIIEQFSSVIELLASKEKVAVTTNKVTEAKVDANKNVEAITVTNEATPAPRKRAPRKKKEE